MIFSIAGRELRSLFLSPLAWAILAVVQLILAWSFLVQVDFFMQIQARLPTINDAPGLTQLIAAPLFGNLAFVLLLVSPLITMRLVSEERRNQTLSLLFSAPVTMTEIILGKYAGIMLFLLLMLAIITLMPLSLLLGGTLDFGMLASGLLGMVLLMASFAAVGLFISALTAQPTIAAVGSFGINLMLWIVDWAGKSRSEGADSVLSYISILRHFENMLKGVFNSADVIYYLLFIGMFLIFSIRRLDADRLQH